MKMTDKWFLVLQKMTQGHDQPARLAICRTMAKRGLLRINERRSQRGVDRAIDWTVHLTPKGRQEYKKEKAERERLVGLGSAQETPKQDAKNEREWSPSDVMAFAGEVLREVMRLAEHGRPIEKRVCALVIERATHHVRDQRFRSAIAKTLQGVF